MLNKNDILDILAKWEFIFGQRAGRELWGSKPEHIQDEDIANFNSDIQKVKEYVANENR